MSDKKDDKIVIEGITESGEKFRPSDWAERMSGSMSHLRGHRVQYDSRLMPITNEDGNKCVLLDPALRESNPTLYASILDFAKKNHLRICNQDNEKSTEGSDKK